MSDVPLTLAIKDYDHLGPLAAGDVDAEGVDLQLERDTADALARTTDDPSVDAGELSFSRYLIGLANDDRRFVGVPVFPTQSFRTRCFFTRREGDLDELADLAGTRIGTNEWPATGNTWCRALLRERGVAIDDADWLVGPVDDPDYPMRPQGDLPSNVEMIEGDATLLRLLLDGDLDALMCPHPPDGFYDEGSPIRRVVPDYRRAEREYYRRTDVYPPHHLIGIRREVFECDPWIARSLFEAFSESKRRWQAERRRLNDTVPWLLPEIEETTALLGEDWLPYGVEAKRREIEVLCREEYEQGLVDEPIDPDTVFEEYVALTGN